MSNKLSNHGDIGQLHALLRRIHRLMERYFDAMENSLAQKDYPFEHRESDARVFNALARALEKLTHLEQLMAEPADAKKLDDSTIRIHLEQRLAQLIDARTEEKIS